MGLIYFLLGIVTLGVVICFYYIFRIVKVVQELSEETLRTSTLLVQFLKAVQDAKQQIEKSESGWGNTKGEA
jgi:hypothetical protein